MNSVVFTHGNWEVVRVGKTRNYQVWQYNGEDGWCLVAKARSRKEAVEIIEIFIGEVK